MVILYHIWQKKPETTGIYEYVESVTDQEYVFERCTNGDNLVYTFENAYWREGAYRSLGH